MRTPRFSVIVPVYNVAPYLRQAIGSVLDQSFEDVEVVAIDDGSQDGSVEILHEIAGRDGRLRIVSHEQNLGLAAARNTGLDAASGEYVLLLDGDDWLAENALTLLDRRLREQPVDVVLFDHVTMQLNGRRKRDPRRSLLRRAPDTPFTLEEAARLLELKPIAVNKAVRLDFIHSHSLAFKAGYYEDVPWTVASMVRAESISVLPEPLYFYRKRAGSITRSTHKRHFDYFDQWEHLWDLLEPLEIPPKVRTKIHDRFSQQAVAILRTERRIPVALERAFFRRAARLYAEHRPASHTPMPGPRGRDQRILQTRRFSLWRLREALAGRRRHVRQQRPAGPASGLRSRWARRRYGAWLRKALEPGLVVIYPRGRRGFRGDLRAVHRELTKVTELHVVWIDRAHGNGRTPKGAVKVSRGSFEYYRALAHAQLVISDDVLPAHVQKRPDATWTLLPAEVPIAFKGADLLAHHGTLRGRRIARRRAKRSACFDVATSGAPWTTHVLSRTLPGISEVIELGYPRTDSLQRQHPASVQGARQKLGVPQGRTTLLYLPAPRDYLPRGEPPIDLVQLSDELGDDIVVLAPWPASSTTAGRASLIREGRLIDVSRIRDRERLLLASDVLVTDRSPAVFDYIHLDRPIVIHAADNDIFAAVHGVYVDLAGKNAPGLVVPDVDELAKAVASGVHDTPATEGLRRRFRDEHCRTDPSDSAVRIVDHLVERPSPT